MSDKRLVRAFDLRLYCNRRGTLQHKRRPSSLVPSNPFLDFFARSSPLSPQPTRRSLALGIEDERVAKLRRGDRGSRPPAREGPCQADLWRSAFFRGGLRSQNATKKRTGEEEGTTATGQANDAKIAG